MSQVLMSPTPAIAPEKLLEIYRAMVLTRTLDLEGIAMQRQGIVPGYAPLKGQEAAQVASAAALQVGDFAFGTYRELGVAVARGVDLVGYMSTHLATWHGGLYNPAKTGFSSINAVVGGGVLHSVGWARAEQIKGDSGVAIAYFGDGASSQGEVHEAMNFAAIEKSPVVFFCQNNGWAISVPTEKQVAGGSVAARAAGYGMPGHRIDGNDPVAVYEATAAAIARARNGDGPSLIEAMTYRLGPHSTSDDPGRYRTLEEETRRGERDPLIVARAGMRAAGLLTDDEDAAIQTEAMRMVEEIRQGVIDLPQQSGSAMFDHVFADPPAALTEQYHQWKENADVF